MRQPPRRVELSGEALALGNVKLDDPAIMNSQLDHAIAQLVDRLADRVDRGLGFPGAVVAAFGRLWCGWMRHGLAPFAVRFIST